MRDVCRQPFRVRCALGVLLAATLAGCGSRDKVAEMEASVYAVPVEVAVAALKQLPVTRTYSGPLEGGVQANIIARISERVTGVKVHVGEAVGVGQLIVALDKTGPASQYLQAEANLKNAEKTLERMKSLLTEGAVPQQTVDGAQTAFDVAKANFDAARAMVELTSPIAGLVTAVNVSDGDLVTMGSTLATVANIGEMKVIFNINETDATDLAIGQHLTVYSEANSARMDGRITQLSKSADVRSRLFEVKAAFPNTPDRWFRPGMFCKVDVRIAPRQESAIIPNAAILSDGTTDRVFVIREGRAYERAVQLGASDGESTSIVRGLAAGDTVATVGMNNLKDSSAVTVVSK